MINQKIEEFLLEQNRSMEALYKPVLLNNWLSATTGNKEWADKHEEALKSYFANFSNSDTFETLLSFRDNNDLTSIQRRQIEDLYNKMVRNQLEDSVRSETLELEKEISQVFNTYRPLLFGQKVTNNELLDILRNSDQEESRKEAWLASKQVGKKIERTLLKLVQKRNKDAKALGFDNFFQMSLSTQELDMNTVIQIFDELRKLSDEPFRLIKDEIDEERATKLGIAKKDIRPWHYVDPFFQEAPTVGGIDLDKVYKNKDLEKLVSETFKSMGLDIGDILKRSDLYPRQDKNPFGFCTNVDRKGDIRVLVNLDESMFWVTALLHEFGHAAYFKYIDKDLPFILRFHSHSLTTEAIALFFGRMNKTLEWQDRFLEIEGNEMKEESLATKKMLQRQMLVSARWMITFTFFEKAMYENPDQDLNKLWWKLVKEIQYVTPPENTNAPDWASKMHFSLAPVSYQDYLLGELTASQLHHHIAHHISSDLFTPKVGEYLIENFFKYGASLHWNDKIKNATGEYLNPSYFANQFLK
ncbi:peptidase M3A and M3B thimet/oligopeptidase F [Anaerobacillus alkaliphilus]|uniref:Peptidase M3A and M3B thimet/oligopeptidase F n=1 Tax=Anaerobacillus alkaliphilus TaxID=1548597 RepID=A0A4Q0VNW3_9BACI|nr:M2 family metallopeptidase [Anaerobacillus alkaliphilus]RXI96726.1 peptidase M3A and M3B thimet/oligopeptidase F [Anaerobacillus alkaliphilus]